MGIWCLKSSPVVSEGMVFIGSLDSNFYAFNAETGAQVWATKTGGPIESSPAFVTVPSTSLLKSHQPACSTRLDAYTGQVLWNLTLPYQYSFVGGTEMLGSPSVAAGMVFASSNWGAYYAVNITTGKEVWHFIDKGAIEFIVSSPIYFDGGVVIIDKFDLTFLNATNGQKIWSAYTGDELYVSPSYADGKIYVTTSQRDIFILDTVHNGATMANATTPSSSWSSPSIANGRLYIGCNDWNIYCFSSYVTGQASASPPMIYVIAAVAAVLVIVMVAVGYLVTKRSKK